MKGPVTPKALAYVETWEDGYEILAADGGEVHDLGDLDREAVKSIFTTMAKCISNVNNNMQILVLEHADSSIYGDVQGINEVCVWRDGEKLIPFEWIG